MMSNKKRVKPKLDSLFVVILAENCADFQHFHPLLYNNF